MSWHPGDRTRYARGGFAGGRTVKKRRRMTLSDHRRARRVAWTEETGSAFHIVRDGRCRICERAEAMERP